MQRTTHSKRRIGTFIVGFLIIASASAYMVATFTRKAPSVQEQVPKEILASQPSTPRAEASESAVVQEASEPSGEVPVGSVVTNDIVPSEVTMQAPPVAKEKEKERLTTSATVLTDDEPVSRATYAPDSNTPPLTEPQIAGSVLQPDGVGLVRDFWIWGGMGVNFTSYTQSVPGMADVTFGRIKAPSTMAKAGFFLADHYALEFGYKDTPGEASSSSTVSVQNGAYRWQTMSVEGLYRFSDESQGKTAEWLGRLGVQQHQMPFITPLTLNSVQIQENSLTAVSLGFEYRKFTRKNLRVEYMLRYQHPVSASSDGASSFSLSSQGSFDGSVGAAYEVRPHVFLGTYWYGQYHSYTFDYRASNGSTFSGEQRLFFSNIDLRLGVEF